MPHARERPRALRNIVLGVVLDHDPRRVTDRILQGVVSIKDGIWYTPNADGVDTRGCCNVLTADRSAPSGASTYNSNFVQITPA